MVDATSRGHLVLGTLLSQCNQGPRIKEERRGAVENQHLLPEEPLVGAAWQVVT